MTLSIRLVFTNCGSNIKLSSFKNNENIQKKEVRGPDRSVSNNKFSSVALNKMAMKTRDDIL